MVALDRGEWSAWRTGHFAPGERASVIHWVGPRTGLTSVKKRKISWPCRESKPSHPDRNPSLYQPSYHGSHKYCKVSPFPCRLIWIFPKHHCREMNWKLHSCGMSGFVFWSPKFGFSAILCGISKLSCSQMVGYLITVHGRFLSCLSLSSYRLIPHYEKLLIAHSVKTLPKF
jgi:hypothetical protein